jgi:D-aminopeptidase
VIAFSTHPSGRIADRSDDKTGIVEELNNDEMSPLFLATVEATQEAIYNSLLMATSVRGWQNHEAKAIPVDQVREICKKYRVIR